ncbi:MULTISPECIES: helix-turn-helix domain-containing protein [unclassified Chryseobacterium]|uniref:helix-turn-helix domain-containing protein n=1 Tax=unclassified Chryseobacterium TaxID=2593645 RepID=UPI00100BC483|nr:MULTISPECIES: AraC family transcriptional regulator [unclassified Chryseobacterium]RXM53156.1 AraC family transcriptional regulator [Chryseobacterium sp. CH25]RXM65652.1 AraC family transcriptional regulator [Chryseobacterium sp. CH1]
MKRSEEIARQYFDFLENHIQRVISGEVSEFMEVNEIAGQLAISHKHLTDTIKKETGQHPCYFYDEEIIRKAKQMLADSDYSVAEIARIFTYDPSNFSKFFKKMTGITPGDFRRSSRG